MGEMMETLTLTDFGVDKEEEKRIKAELKFAVNIGLIQNDSPKAIDERRIMKNHQNEEDTLINKIVYGITSYSREAYIRYELTDIRLDFASEAEKVKYDYEPISDAEMEEFYKENTDLFTRADGDSFDFDEVKLIIKKKMRELEYEKNVNLLCEQL